MHKDSVTLKTIGQLYHEKALILHSQGSQDKASVYAYQCFNSALQILKSETDVDHIRDSCKSSMQQILEDA